MTGSARPARLDLLDGRGIGFLLSQLGAHSSRRWNQVLAAENLDSRQVMLLWNVAIAQGRSQRELADALGLPGSRIVGLVNALEGDGLVERRPNPHDRRARALYLTPEGEAVMDRVLSVAAAEEVELGNGLTTSEERVLIELLGKLAIAQGLRPRVHPDF